jgi:hypothetical protein
MKKEFTGNNFTAVFTDEDGHFSLTGHAEGGTGAIGNKLSKIDPRFEMLNKMHLSNSETGEPMHSWENANYFIRENNTKALKNLLRHKVTEYTEAYNARYDAESLEKAISGYAARVTQPAIARLQAVRTEIIELWKRDVIEVQHMVESIPEDLTDIDEDVTLSDYEYPERVKALAQHLVTHFSTITESGYNDNILQAEGSYWLVVTDDEADDLWDESLDSYLDECVFPDLPETTRNYFDTDAWKRDARMDGRGHNLDKYDGSEYFETVDGETYFIYQQ